ncbi:MAG TPA: vWA domain-containing protein, partial [Polyangiaceae bacterium]|nr:vWA domain-containing protein [Polyangiaceae bacterium]
MRLKLLVGMSLYLGTGCGSDAGDTVLSRTSDSVSDGGTDVADAAKAADVDAGAADAGPRDAGKKDAHITVIDAGDPEPCESHSENSTPTIPQMLIVLDRSGSMNANGNDQGTDRWGGSVQAVTQVTSAYDKRIDFGLMTFPAVVENPGLFDDTQCTPGKVDVPIGPGTGSQIGSALGAMNADGRTPTAASLMAALDVLGQPQIGDGVVAAPRYVLLVTDGDPNCSGGNVRNGVDATARQQTLAAITALAAAGVKTYVVGFQTAGTAFAQQLDMMAAAGDTGETTHHSVESGADLSTTFEQIAAQVVSCSQQLENPVDDPTYVLVTVNGTARAFGNSSDGWTLGTDSQTVTLTGAACDALQSGAHVEVQVQCAPVV